MRKSWLVSGVAATVAVGVVVSTQWVSGAGESDESVFVSTTPCRLVDTRSTTDNVGPVSSPVGADATVEFNAHDGNDDDSSCEIPVSATAISANVVAVGPTARSFLTLFPGDVTNPGTANLNFVAGQAPTPNAAVVPLAADGSFNQPSSNVGAQGPAGADGSDGANGPVDGSACTARGIAGTVNSGYDIDGNFYVACLRTPEGIVTTLAGTATLTGTDDQFGANARFTVPFGMAVDTAGNVYVADTNNHRIRKINPVGGVTTLAGSTSGFADGTGTAAQFNSPYGVAVDTAGNVYVAGIFNHRIRKITPAGVVTTLAGSIAGFADGTGEFAQFNNPYGVAVDGSGNVYVADANNDRIRKINPVGGVTTLAGSTPGSADGTGNAAQFNNPYGVAVDTAGNVYVADRGNHTIRKIR